MLKRYFSAPAIGVGLIASLVILWVFLSGYFTVFFLGLGAASVMFVVFIVMRMDVVDHEAQPFYLRFVSILRYWCWLGFEIVRANIAVCRIILHPQLPISATVLQVKSSQKTLLGRVLFANSITLTPGTVSIDMDADQITVHALTTDSAEELRQGEMDRRVTAVEVVPSLHHV